VIGRQPLLSADGAQRPLIARLQPGVMQELHWHPDANEWFFVSK
jgi:hypothetical protein